MLFESVLMVISSQCLVIIDCRVIKVPFLWNTIIAALQDSSSSVIIMALKLSGKLIELGKFPQKNKATTLCQQIGLTIQNFVKAYRFDSSRNQVSCAFEAFRYLFSAIIKQKRTLSKASANHLLNTLTPLLEPNIPFIKSVTIGSSTSELIAILLSSQPIGEEYVFLKNVEKCMTDLQCLEHIMPVVEKFIKRQMSLSNLREENKKSEVEKMDIPRDSEECSLMQCDMWKHALSLVISNIEKLKSSSRQDEQLLRLISVIVNSASHLSSSLDKSQRGTVIVFDEAFYCSIVALTSHSITLANLNCVEYLVSIISELVTLPEVEELSDDVVEVFVKFLSLPWWDASNSDSESYPHFMTVVDLYENCSSKDVIDNIKKQCLIGFGQMVGIVLLEWRIKFLSKCFSEKTFPQEIIYSIPILLKNAPNCFPTLANFVLQPALNMPDLLEPAAKAVSTVICVLSGTGVKSRTHGSRSMGILCRECDTGETEGEAVLNKQVRNLLRGILMSLLTSSPQATCTIISLLPRLANHLSMIYTLDCAKQWMQLVKHPNNDVRDIFAKVVADLLFRKKWIKRHKDSVLEEVGLLSQDDRQQLTNSEMLFTSFSTFTVKAIQDSLINCNKSLQMSTIKAIGCVGSAPVDCVLYPSFKMLLILILHPKSVHLSVAETYLQKIAVAHNKTVQQIFFKYRSELCKLIIDMSLLNMPFSNQNLTHFLNNVYRALSYSSCKAFLKQNASSHILKYMLPLMASTKPELDVVLNHIAKTIGVEVSALVSDGFQFIFPHVYMEENEETLEKTLTLIFEITYRPIASSVCGSYKVIICEILLYFPLKKERVLKGLQYLKSCEPGNVSAEEQGNVVELLAPRFLGILNLMETKFVMNGVSDSEKKSVLLALPEIFYLMGPSHITPVRLKVLATLRAALSLCHDSFPDLTCAVWEAFVHSVELSALAPLISTVFISLLPLLENFCTKISRIFHFLIVENEHIFTSYIHELFFVPDMPAIQEVYNVIQQKIRENENLSIREQLMLTVKLAKHENVEVRLHGLQKLQEHLKSNWAFISELILNSDSLDPFIVEFLDALIVGSHDEEERIRVACGECFGALGALDPGCLTSSLMNEKKSKNVPLSINSHEFAVAALMSLVRGFQEARSTMSMDAIALAIQELLKIYKISPKSKKVWESFPTTVQETMTLFLSTRYMPDPTSIVGMHPIFGSSLGKTMRFWAFNWASSLIPLAASQIANQVFTACRLSLKKDIQLLLFFLPYILLHAILKCTEENKKKIEEEIMTVLNWSGEQDVTDKQLFELKRVRKTIIMTELPNDPEQGLTHMMCVKTVYSLLDFLFQWLRETKQHCSKQQSSLTVDYETVKAFLKRFSLLNIANGSFDCQEYARALLYLEEYASENPRQVQKLLPTFGKIYKCLKEPDGLRGVIAIHENEPTPSEMLLYHELTGQLHDAATCYERLAQGNDNPEFHKGMVQCYLSMDQPFTALTIAEAVLARNSKHCIDLHGERSEAIWSLTMMNQLENALKSPEVKDNNSWGVNIGKAMLHFRNKDEPSMMNQLHIIRKNLVQNLSTATVTAGGYRQGYDYIVKLHILNEFEKIGRTVLSMLSEEVNNTTSEQFELLVSKELDQRLKLLQPTRHVLQPVLCMRRVVFSIAETILSDHVNTIPFIKQAISKCWLKSTALARKSSNFQQAYSNILAVEIFNPKGLFIEKAKLHWAKSESEAAIATLRRGIEQNFPEQNKDTSKQETRLLAKAKLLIATYNDANVNVDLEMNLGCFKEAVEVCKDWEKSIVCLAQFQYRYFREYKSEDFCSAKGLECQLQIINYFGKSLQYGCKFIYQSMPRMLEIWLEFGTRLAQNLRERTQHNLVEQQKAMKNMVSLIEAFSERLPTYMFMTAMSQLTSRICHPLKDCHETIKKLIAKIIKEYPQQALWMFISVYKSPYKIRVERCEALLNDPLLLNDPHLAVLISHFKVLTDKLSDLCRHTMEENVNETTVKALVKTLPRLFTQKGFSSILMPAQKFRTLSLPRSADYSSHNPYQQTMVYIYGMKDHVQIITSLQRPKKITFIGSDGLLYPMMCKARDDLRLDFRLMEFNSIVNMYLQRTPEARDRRMHIRTYSVVPLNDDCGLIEWVDNLVGIRPIIMKLYSQMGKLTAQKILKAMYCDKNDSLAKKRQVFIEKLLPKHPPVLREWFLQEFPHPTSWYQARTAYVRTTAVMSIVGYIVGLGDRHGENILLDSESGEVMHVDFNCLFNKGERFEWAERVPFRLTHNMVNAMGPTGYEGMFVEACEITVRLMRVQIEQLLSVVRPFIYDPLLSWNRNKSLRDENAEMMNELARENILNIQHRLLGRVRNKSKGYTDRILSVEGQTQNLIAEATNIDNLCQMFSGWGPFL